MKTVGAYDAKTRLSELLNEVEKGERITITKHGLPVAELVPPPHKKSMNPGAVISEIRRFRSGILLGELSIRRLIEEGRR